MTAPRVPVTRPDLGDAEAEAAARVVRSGWVMQGPEVAAFEREFAAAVGAAHAIAVANGTVAIELALRALDLAPGDEVATVSHSFVATANAVVAVGARPVFVDVEAGTFGMDPAALDAAIGPRTRAILCVHQLGFPCDLAGVLAVAARRGLPVVEDAACALGSAVQVEPGSAFEPIGRPHGLLATFSFHPRKVITTGDGGMITTADPALAERLRRLRNHGVSVAADARGGAGGERYLEPAVNARLSDLAAAVGRPQLARLATSIAARRRIAAAYAAALRDHPILAAPAERPAARANFQSYPALVRPGARLDQAAVLAFLAERGIVARGGVTNAHQEPAYARRGNFRAGPLPVSEELRARTVMLPIFQGLTDAELAAVTGALSALAAA